MDRLLYVMPYTTDLEGLAAFYRERVGLEPRSETPFFVQFDGLSHGASFGLLAVGDDQRREIELCFESRDVDADVAMLESRGVRFLDAPRTRSFGRVVHLRDPEDHLVSLLQPAPGLGAARAPETMKPDPGWQAGMAGALAAAARTAGGAVAVAAQSPRFSSAIVRCREVPAMQAFYRELGLRLEEEIGDRVVLDAGGATLALRPLEAGASPGVTLAFSVGDLRAWHDEARQRGMSFARAPREGDGGLMVEAVDPEGNGLVFREPPPPAGLEDRLAEEFEDDDSPSQAAIRKPLKKGVRAVSRVAIKPDYKASRPRPRARDAEPPAERQGLRVHSARGTGPERTRATPKNLADPKRARSRPAVGRLKKAEARSAERKKTAMARASKSKPIKQAAASRGKKRLVRKASGKKR